jgi:sugar phosphate isomerase/epimerase
MRFDPRARLAGGLWCPILPEVRMKIGIVTYNLAREWDLPTLIERCAATGMQGVELRTGHAHQVEVGLTPQQRKEVRQRFADSPVELAGLGSAFEYHSVDPGEVRRNIEGTKEYVKLAADVGAPGVKVRPNGLNVDKGVPKEQTLEQIGKALRECGEFAHGCGVEIRLEVHGKDTSLLPNIRAILGVADHDNVFACWNSNQSDLVDGSVRQSFDLVRGRIRLVHMRDLYLEDYPWRELLGLLQDSGYQGYCLAEVSESADPERVMRYYRALWLAYQGAQ